MALLTADQRALAPALGASKAIWTGRPLPGLHFRRGDGLLLFSGVFALAFFAFWESGAAMAPPIFRIFGAVVFALILAQTFGPFVWTLLTQSRTYYALTDDGFAIIYIAGFGGLTKRILLPALDTIDLQMSAGGSGTIVFGAVPGQPWWTSRRGYSPPRLPAFEAIPDAGAVYDLCARLQSRSKESA